MRDQIKKVQETSASAYEKTFNAIANIRPGGGLVGRTCTVLIVASAAVGFIGSTTENPYVRGGSLFCMIVIFYLLQRVIRYADKNPSVAYFEASEILKLLEMQAAAKGVRGENINPEEKAEDETPTSESEALDMEETDSDLPDSNSASGSEE